jgi:NAD(P)-dependent dehydrogenase (short-subunit alcohol dehydrogenase family)
MDLNPRGKLTLVTGASKEIGLACARQLAEEGCHLHLVAHQGGPRTRRGAGPGGDFPVRRVPLRKTQSARNGSAMRAFAWMGRTKRLPRWSIC